MIAGNDILNYQGNVGLGLSESGAVTHYGDTDTKDLSNSVFNLAYLNMQKNKEVWQQKVKDRDEAMAQIASGQLQINNSLPEDRQKLMDNINEVEKIFYDNGGDVKSDPKIWLNMQDKLGTFKGNNTLAQSRLTSYQQGMSEAANELDPVAKQKMLDHWAEQRKLPIDQPFTPYQKTLDWDTNKVFLPIPDGAPIETREGDEDVKETMSDPGKGWLNYLDAYSSNDKGDTQPHMDAFNKSFFGLDGLVPHEVVVQKVTRNNMALKKIATLLKYPTTTQADIDALPQYLQPIKMHVDPIDGKWKPVDTVPMANYKVNLALKFQHSIKHEFNAEYGKARLQNAQSAAEYSKIPLNKANAYRNKAIGHYWDNKASALENENKITNIFDDVVARAKQLPITTMDKNGKVTGTSDQSVVLAQDVPPGLLHLGGIDKKGAPKDLEPMELPGQKDANGKPVMGFQVVKSPYLITPDGKMMSDDFLHTMYEKTRTELAKQGITSYDQMVEEFTKPSDQGGRGFRRQTELQGANGRGTSQSTIQAIRALNDKISKSKEGITNPSDNSQD